MPMCPDTENLADGGDVGDDDALMDHVALECMNAIETKDKEQFLDSFRVLVADLLNKVQGPVEGEK